VAADFEFIDDDARFGDLVDRLCLARRYAIDTEFHRERTYFPKVALLQVADGEGVAVVDALAVDLGRFREVLEGPGLAVMHAARQDLEVLERSCGTVPSRILDTQIAAGFLGYTSPALAALLEREVGVRTGKADRLTDWLRRPLTEAQLSYAADDVAHLLALHDRLVERLEDKGRMPWVEEACEELRGELRGPRPPEDAWRRIKEIRHLKGTRLALGQRVAAWREERAAAQDITPRFVLSDLGVVSVASSAPRTLDELRSLRGIDGRALRGGIGESLLEVVKAADGARPAARDVPRVAELPSELRPVVPLISAWVSARSRELELETSMLATRADLEDLLRGAPDARLTEGWRAELVGEPIRRLVAGEAAIAFVHGRGLVLEDRCGDPPVSR
jgi:ribonuclease D